VVVEHNLEFKGGADWIVEWGPEPATAGARSGTGRPGRDSTEEEDVPTPARVLEEL